MNEITFKSDYGKTDFWEISDALFKFCRKCAPLSEEEDELVRKFQSVISSRGSERDKDALRYAEFWKSNIKKWLYVEIVGGPDNVKPITYTKKMLMYPYRFIATNGCLCALTVRLGDRDRLTIEYSDYYSGGINDTTLMPNDILITKPCTIKAKEITKEEFMKAVKETCDFVIRYRFNKLEGVDTQDDCLRVNFDI